MSRLWTHRHVKVEQYSAEAESAIFTDFLTGAFESKVTSDLYWFSHRSIWVLLFKERLGHRNGAVIVIRLIERSDKAIIAKSPWRSRTKGGEEGHIPEHRLLLHSLYSRLRRPQVLRTIWTQSLDQPGMVGFKMRQRKVMWAHSKDFAFEVLLRVCGAALVDGEGGGEFLEPHWDVQKEGGNLLILLVAPIIEIMLMFIEDWVGC